MNPPVNLRQTRQILLIVLLCIACGVPTILSTAAPDWLPDWLGASLALGALVAALLMCWKDGALRMRFLASFLAALALAAVGGWWMAGHG